MKKPILFLDQQSWLSGGQRVLEIVLDSLAEEYHPIVVLPGDGPFRQRLANKNIETLTFPLGSYRTGKKPRSEMLAFAARSLICARGLAGVIRRRQVGLVYINGPRCLAAGVLAARCTGRPSLFHLHLTLTRGPEIFLSRRMARRTSSIIACSRAAAAALVGNDAGLARKTRVIYNPAGDWAGVPAPPAERAAADPSSVFTVGVVGRITQAKGQRVFLNAVGRLPSQLKSKFRVIFVGAPSPDSRADLEYQQRLEDCVSQFDLGARVQWAGYQPDMAAYYRAMDLLVHPSLAQSGEAMPLAILEARRHGIPVIASWAGGIPEIVRHGVTGLLYPPGDEAALTRALERFLVDSSLRQRLRAGASSPTERRFSLENFHSQLHEQIWQLCQSRNAGAPQALQKESAA